VEVSVRFVVLLPLVAFLAIFTNADLTGATWADADIKEPVCTGATGVSFSGASVDGGTDC
jgi:uncharacterized protein YjbI with pentapeptide repeats